MTVSRRVCALKRREGSVRGVARPKSETDPLPVQRAAVAALRSGRSSTRASVLVVQPAELRDRVDTAVAVLDGARLGRVAELSATTFWRSVTMFRHGDRRRCRGVEPEQGRGGLRRSALSRIVLRRRRRRRRPGRGSRRGVVGGPLSARPRCRSTSRRGSGRGRPSAGGMRRAEETSTRRTRRPGRPFPGGGAAALPGVSGRILVATSNMHLMCKFRYLADATDSTDNSGRETPREITTRAELRA